jgi:septum formation protein
VAAQKELCLYDQFPDNPIITADTVVALDGRLFLKPESPSEAFSMLSELAGKKHSVFTGVTVALGHERHTLAEESLVEFHTLTEKEVRTYHNSFHPLDKAGAYAIQRGGSVIVKRIEGCYYNIMGLPLNTTRLLLAKIGIDLWDYLKSV